MSEDYKVQVSLSAPPPAQYAKGAMANFRGDTVEEVVDQLEKARDLSLLELASEVESVWTAAAALGAQTVNTVPSNAAQPAQAAQPNVGQGRFCQHGQRVRDTGIAKSGRNAGNPYTRWKCPLDTWPRHPGVVPCKPEYE